MPGTLYRLLDAEGECIYIGASMHGATRLGQHAGKDWWPEVATVDVAHFDTRDEAFNEETRLLKDKLPKYNKRGGGRPLTEAQLAARRKRREEKEREAAEEEATTYRSPAVRCTNCDDRPWTLPKGQLIGDVPCENCGCKALALPAPKKAAA